MRYTRNITKNVVETRRYQSVSFACDKMTIKLLQGLRSFCFQLSFNSFNLATAQMQHFDYDGFVKVRI